MAPVLPGMFPVLEDVREKKRFIEEKMFIKTETIGN